MTRRGDCNDAAPVKIMLCAVEPSGDALGAALMKALKARAPSARLFGCGGPQMAAQGLDSLFPIEPLSVMGPADALKALPAALSGARKLAFAAAAETADAAVLIDSWAFSHMAAKRIRKTAPETKLIKFVAPQVWASRPHRAETLANLFDGVLTLFAFENSWFENAGVKTRFVGNPVFQRAARQQSDGAAFREKHAIGDAPLLAVLPGSRRGEVSHLIGSFRATVEILSKAQPDLRIVIPMAPAVENDVRAATADWSVTPVLLSAEERFDAFAAANAALAVSGTVTTELAISKTPMIVVYRVGPLTALWVRRVITTPYASLINIAAEREVIPEFLQEAARPDAMAAALSPLFGETPERAAQLAAFPPLLEKLGVGGPDAAALAAETVLSWAAEERV